MTMWPFGGPASLTEHEMKNEVLASSSTKDISAFLSSGLQRTKVSDAQHAEQSNGGLDVTPVTVLAGSVVPKKKDTAVPS